MPTGEDDQCGRLIVERLHSEVAQEVGLVGAPLSQQEDRTRLSKKLPLDALGRIRRFPKGARPDAENPRFASESARAGWSGPFFPRRTQDPYSPPGKHEAPSTRCPPRRSVVYVRLRGPVARGAPACGRHHQVRRALARSGRYISAGDSPLAVQRVDRRRGNRVRRQWRANCQVPWRAPGGWLPRLAPKRPVAAAQSQGWAHWDRARVHTAALPRRGSAWRCVGVEPSSPAVGPLSFSLPLCAAPHAVSRRDTAYDA